MAMDPKAMQSVMQKLAQSDAMIQGMAQEHANQAQIVVDGLIHILRNYNAGGKNEAMDLMLAELRKAMTKSIIKI